MKVQLFFIHPFNQYSNHSVFPSKTWWTTFALVSIVKLMKNHVNVNILYMTHALQQIETKKKYKYPIKHRMHMTHQHNRDTYFIFFFSYLVKI